MRSKVCQKFISLIFALGFWMWSTTAVAAIHQSDAVYEKIQTDLMVADVSNRFSTPSEGDEGFEASMSYALTLMLTNHVTRRQHTGFNEEAIVKDSLETVLALHKAFGKLFSGDGPFAQALKQQDIFDSEDCQELNEIMDEQFNKMDAWIKGEKRILDNLGIDGYIYHFFATYSLDTPFPKPPLNS